MLDEAVDGLRHLTGLLEVHGVAAAGDDAQPRLRQLSADLVAHGAGERAVPLSRDQQAGHVDVPVVLHDLVDPVPVEAVLAPEGDGLEDHGLPDSEGLGIREHAPGLVHRLARHAGHVSRPVAVGLGQPSAHDSE